jgi:hypothetical protein
MAGNRYLVGFVAGLVVGVVATIGVMQHKIAWIDAGSIWMTLPSHAHTGPLPQTFTMPAKAYDYGAATDALSPATTAAGPMMLKVQLGTVSGNVGLSLATPDGSALVSREHALTSKDSGHTVYFRLPGSQGPVSLLARNYADEGHTGSIELKSATYAAEARLDSGTMGEINKAGVY